MKKIKEQRKIFRVHINYNNKIHTPIIPNLKRYFCTKEQNFEKKVESYQEKVEFDEKLLSYIRCPISKEDLVMNNETSVKSVKMEIKYPIEDGIQKITSYDVSY